MKSPVLFNERDFHVWMAEIRMDYATRITPTTYPVIVVVLGDAREFVYPDDFVWLKVGIGATEIVGSDRYPYTVVEVLSDKKIVVQADDYKRTDKNGMSESQTYEYTPNPNSLRVVVTLRKNGRWVREGESGKGRGFAIGHRDAHQDPHF